MLTSLLSELSIVRIVNLVDRTDRKREVTEELRKHGLAIGGPVEFYRATRPTEPGEFPSTGVRGCFESHMNVLEEAARLGSTVWILEDDVELSPRLATEAQGIAEQLSRSTWDIAYLGHGLGGQQARATFRPSKQPIVMLHCYAVHARCAPRLVEFLKLVHSRPFGHPDGGAMHVDGAISTFRAQNPDVVTLVLEPSLAWQRASASDISPKWFDRLPVVGRSVAILRGARRRVLRLVQR